MYYGVEVVRATECPTTLWTKKTKPLEKHFGTIALIMLWNSQCVSVFEIK